MARAITGAGSITSASTIMTMTESDRSAGSRTTSVPLGRGTEHPRPTPARPAGASNLRLYLIALLALVYLAAWWVFGARAARPPALAPVAPAPEPSEQPRLTIWYQDLPPPARPAVQLPTGWRIADGTTRPPGAVVRALPIPVRVAPARVGRIRTRSS